MAKIYKRGNVWYSYLQIGGKRIHHALSSDKSIAEERLGELIKQRNALRHGHAPVNMLWEAFRNEILKASKTNKKIQTWQAEVRAFRELGSVAPIKWINQITPRFLEETVKPTWIKRGRGKHVINRDLRTIRGAMRKAEAYGCVARQDWTTNKYLTVPKGRLHFFTVLDLLKLNVVCHGCWRTILYLGARAGLRREEMHTLKWTNVDFERNRIHIEPTEEWTPKDNERRFIPMAKDLSEYLLSIKNGDEYVLADHGERPTLGSMTTYFHRLVKKAKLTGSIYTLRHTFGSHLASAGVPPKAIQEMLGHSKIETTDIYMHLVPGTSETSITKLPPITYNSKPSSKSSKKCFKQTTAISR